MKRRLYRSKLPAYFLIMFIQLLLICHCEFINNNFHSSPFQCFYLHDFFEPTLASTSFDVGTVEFITTDRSSIYFNRNVIEAKRKKQLTVFFSKQNAFSYAASLMRSADAANSVN